MNRAMTHDEAFMSLDAAALDVLDPLERDAVLSHAESCPICRAELSLLRDTAASIAFSSPLSADTATRSRARVHDRLLARAQADRGAGGPGVAETRRNRVEWLAVAAGILLAISLTVLASVVRDRAELRTALISRDSVIAGLTGKDVAMMTLTSNGSTGSVAHMFWDKAHNTWTLVAHNMPAPKPGRTYQLWLVTPTAKISAGTFDTKNGEAMVRATYALSPDQLKMLAVTDEPAGGMPQPTGEMVMSAVAH